MRKEPVTVSIPELKEILGRYLDAGPGLNYAVKIVGHPGIGKSDAVRQVARDRNFLFIDTRLAFKENIDLGGYPVPDHEAARMIYYRPHFIPPPEVPDGYGGILWFLDEANRAHPTVIQTLFQIITEGVCGEHALPPGTRVVLAGNLGEEDRTAVTEFDDAALDGRLAIFHLKPDAADWLSWARREGIHPSVVRYISRYPEKLWDETRIHPNPRGWHQVSEALVRSYGLDTHEALAGHLGRARNPSVEKMVSALVGQVACNDFITGITAPRALSTEEVLAGDAAGLERVRNQEAGTEDLLWALSGALDVLRDANIAARGALSSRRMVELANTLSFIALLRADMRVSFFHQLVRQCSLFSVIPSALELMEDREAAATLARFFQEVLEGE